MTTDHSADIDVSPESEIELRSLRERAYGPNADIDGDLVAVRRLRELERATPPREPPREAIAAEAAAVSESAMDDSLAILADAAATSPKLRFRRRLTLAWVASLVLVALAASALTTAIARSADAPYATLAVRSEGEVPVVALQGLSESDAVRYTDFYGVALVSGISDFSRGENRMCLIALADGEAASGEGAYGACAAPGLNPVLDYVVDEFSSEQLRAVFASGTPLRFALNGDRIDVCVGDQPEV